MKIDVLDLFSGCGGFSKGLSQAGFDIQNHYFSEVDKYAIANYKHNFKNSNYVGAVQDVRGIKADIITFGSPCQDFSLAGKRKGMDGSRSSLILEAIRIIGETRPSVFIWENVKGAYSSNGGADFWGIIAAFANIGGYRLEWQLLNTSWFLPQRRERVYLVGYIGEPRDDWRGVFPLGECYGKNHTQARSESDTAYTITRRYWGAKSQGTYIGAGDKIRAMTELECERLQGFPDNWTDCITRSHRYEALGNAVTVDVVQAIANKLHPLFEE